MKYPEKLLTLAVSRHIIGVVPEQKNCTGTKNKKFEKTPHLKQALLAGACFFKPIIYKKLLRHMLEQFLISIGGAAGYCPRVR